MKKIENYEKPIILQKLELLWKKYKQKDWYSIGFSKMSYLDRYNITPKDVIPFATNGIDGIHFGFLTKSGKIDNLNEAPIVWVDPGAEKLLIAAKNIEDLLSLIITTGSSWVDYASQEDFNSSMEDMEEEKNELDLLDKDNPDDIRIIEDWNQKNELIKIIENEMGIKKMENIYEYLKNIRQKITIYQYPK